MSDTPRGPGWWMADDQRWYPPHLRSGASTSPPAAAHPPPAHTRSTGAPPSRNLWKGLTAAAVVLAVVLIATIAVILTRDSDIGPSSAATTPVSSTTNSPISTTTTTALSGPETTTPEPSPPATAPAAASPIPGPGGIANEAPGFLCKDLVGKGYSYPDAVDYWQAQGQPEAMDADKNGIPCETTYSERDVILYWGSTGPVADGTCPSPSTLLSSLRATPQLDDAIGNPRVLGEIQCSLPFATAFDTTPGEGETAQILFKAISGYWVALDGGTGLDCVGQWSVPASDAEILGC